MNPGFFVEAKNLPLVSVRPIKIHPKALNQFSGTARISWGIFCLEGCVLFRVFFFLSFLPSLALALEGCHIDIRRVSIDILKSRYRRAKRILSTHRPRFKHGLIHSCIARDRATNQICRLTVIATADGSKDDIAVVCYFQDWDG